MQPDQALDRAQEFDQLFKFAVWFSAEIWTGPIQIKTSQQKKLHPNLVPKRFNVLNIVSSHSHAAFTSVIIFKWDSCSGCTVTKKNGDCFCSFLFPIIPVLRLLLLPKLQQEKDLLTMFLLSKELCPTQHKVCRFRLELLSQSLEIVL